MHVTFCIGMAMIMTPLMTASLGSLPRALYGHGSAIVNTLPQLAGAAGTAILIAAMSIGASKAAADGAGAVAAQVTGTGRPSSSADRYRRLRALRQPSAARGPEASSRGESVGRRACGAHRLTRRVRRPVWPLVGWERPFEAGQPPRGVDADRRHARRVHHRAPWRR